MKASHLLKVMQPVDSEAVLLTPALSSGKDGCLVQKPQRRQTTAERAGAQVSLPVRRFGIPDGSMSTGEVLEREGLFPEDRAGLGGEL